MPIRVRCTVCRSWANAMAGYCDYCGAPVDPSTAEEIDDDGEDEV